jgi:hypothetical protein
MKKSLGMRTTIFLSVAVLVAVSIPAAGRSHRVSQFTYAAGTEPLPEGCEGKLELLQTTMVFECSQGNITAAYSSITLMEYRPKVSREVRKMKLHWAIKPTTERGKHNLFFTVVFSDDQGTHVMVLRVLPDIMRPYLAEIELRAGRRVDVERLE